MNEKTVPLPAPEMSVAWKTKLLRREKVCCLSLSPRQLEVWKLYAEGLSTFEIADKLGVSIKTIDTFRTQIRAKTGMRNPADFARGAVAVGLIQVEVLV